MEDYNYLKKYFIEKEQESNKLKDEIEKLKLKVFGKNNNKSEQEKTENTSNIKPKNNQKDSNPLTSSNYSNKPSTEANYDISSADLNFTSLSHNYQKENNFPKEKENFNITFKSLDLQNSLSKDRIDSLRDFGKVKFYFLLYF